MRRILLMGLAALPGCGGDPARPASADVPAATATVTRQDLVETDDVPGTLGFAGTRRVAAAAAGTLTRLRPEGSVVPRGRSLYSVDGEAAAFVLRGGVPAYRELRQGVADGRDVRQLERNLRGMGYDPGVVDDTFTGTTASAVRSWEDDRGSVIDGAVAPGEVVIVDGTARVGRHRAEVGDRVGAGAPVLEVSTTERQVTAKLDAGRQGAVREGARVTVTLPDGTEQRGRVVEVGRVAEQSSEEGADPTVDLRVRISGRRARFDGAPVTVAVPVATLRDALAVPVTALVAVGPGRYAVERPGDAGRVPVRVEGIVAGQAAIEGVPEGTRLVVPR